MSLLHRNPHHHEVSINDGAFDFRRDDLLKLLRDYDPRQLPQVKAGCIARIPATDLVLRYDPANTYVGPIQTPARLESHLQRYEAHLQWLKDLGLGVADHSIYTVNTDPHARRHRPMVYTVVPYLGRGVTLADVYLRHADEDTQAAVLNVASTLRRYYTLPPEEPHTLLRPGERVWDIDTRSQYALDGTLYDYNAHLTTRVGRRAEAIDNLTAMVYELPMTIEQQTVYNGLLMAREQFRLAA
jgi:hypothetical protein